VYGDAAYRDTQRRNKLEGRGVFYGVMHKRVRGQKKFTAEQKHYNRLCARVRGLCEMPFAWLMRSGRKRTRYRGLRKTGKDFGLWALGYNLWRSLSIKAPKYKTIGQVRSLSCGHKNRSSRRTG